MQILILANHDIGVYNFRKELIEQLLQNGHEVLISSPYGERIELLRQMGCKYEEVCMDRHGKNPLTERKLISYYKKLITRVRPDIIFSYTIKPNLYGAMAAASRKVSIVVNITGLGLALNGVIWQKALTAFYKIAFRKVQTVFVQNEEGKDFFLKHNIAEDRLKLLPGSGVNLEQFHVLDYPNDESIQFVFIGRIMKEKGIDQYLEMAEYIKKKYPQTYFHICGFCEEEYDAQLKNLEEKGIITYHGLVMDVREVLAYTHCTVHPTYYPEGISNILLESAASGRPIITTDHCGCKEVVEDGINGYMVSQRDTRALINAIEKFINLTNEQRRQMGLAGRRKVEKEFDRQIVVEAYIRELE